MLGLSSGSRSRLQQEHTPQQAARGPASGWQCPHLATALRSGRTGSLSHAQPAGSTWTRGCRRQLLSPRERGLPRGRKHRGTERSPSRAPGTRAWEQRLWPWTGEAEEPAGPVSRSSPSAEQGPRQSFRPSLQGAARPPGCPLPPRPGARTATARSGLGRRKGRGLGLACQRPLSPNHSPLARGPHSPRPLTRSRCRPGPGVAVSAEHRPHLPPRRAVAAEQRRGQACPGQRAGGHGSAVPGLCVQPQEQDRCSPGHSEGRAEADRGLQSGTRGGQAGPR